MGDVLMADIERLHRAKVIEQIVEWLREFGDHPPAPWCARCNIADAIERGEPWDKNDG